MTFDENHSLKTSSFIIYDLYKGIIGFLVILLFMKKENMRKQNEIFVNTEVNIIILAHINHRSCIFRIIVVKSPLNLVFFKYFF